MRKATVPRSPGPTNTDTQFRKGRSGNRNGRPMGSRNKLSEAFLADMLADWEENGAAAIVAFRDGWPNEYVKVMAGLVPKEFAVKVNELEELSDEQLNAQLAAVLRELAADGFNAVTGDQAAEEREPAGAVPTIQ